MRKRGMRMFQGCLLHSVFATQVGERRSAAEVLNRHPSRHVRKAATTPTCTSTTTHPPVTTESRRQLKRSWSMLLFQLCRYLRLRSTRTARTWRDCTRPSEILSSPAVS